MDLVGQLDVSGRIVEAAQALDKLRESLELAGGSSSQLRTVANAVQAVEFLSHSLRVVEVPAQDDAT